MPYLALLLILTLSHCTGYSLVRLVRRQEPALEVDLIERLFLYVGAGLLFNGWCALTLAELGFFNFWLVVLLNLTLIGLAWRLHGRPGLDLDLSFNPSITTPALIETFLLLTWLVIAIPLFFRPHEVVIGIGDAGVYTTLSGHIATEGSIRKYDPLLAKLDTRLYPAFLRTPEGENRPYWQPGYYVLDETGWITPRFYHLAPAWQAIAYSLAGVNGSLFMPPLWALVGALMVYLTGRRLWGWQFACLALWAVSFNALQLWFARYPTTETFTQFLIWLGMWAFLVWADDWYKQKIWGLVAGVAWGSLLLTRIDTILVLAVPFLLLFNLWRQGKLTRPVGWFYLPLLLLTGQAILHIWVFSRSYFLELADYLWRLAVYYAQQYPLLLLLVGVLLALLFASWSSFNRLKETIPSLSQFSQFLEERKVVQYFLLLLVIAAGIFLWFIRPALVTEPFMMPDSFSGQAIPTYDDENFVRFGWYVSVITLGWAIAGWALWTSKIDRRAWPVLCVGFLFSALYFWSSLANPHHIYVWRRYLPAVLPFAVLGCTYFVRWLWMQPAEWFKGVSITAAAVWLVALLWMARGYTAQVDYVDSVNQINALAQNFPAGSVLLFNSPGLVDQGDFLGMPLAMLHNQHVFVLRDPEKLEATLLDQAIDEWQSTGRTVYWINNPAGHPWPIPTRPLPTTPTFTYQINLNYLEATYDRKPSQQLWFNWPGEVYLVP